MFYVLYLGFWLFASVVTMNLGLFKFVAVLTFAFTIITLISCKIFSIEVTLSEAARSSMFSTVFTGVLMIFVMQNFYKINPLAAGIGINFLFLTALWLATKVSINLNTKGATVVSIANIVLLFLLLNIGFSFAS